jgi:hypothetical protein
MDSNSFPTPKTATELRYCAARAKQLALATMDDLAISRLEQLARDYEAEAVLIERTASGRSE